MKALAVVLAVLGAVGLAALAIAFGALIDGFVLSTLWGWLIVPLGLPPLSLVAAMGVSLVVSYVTYHYRADDCFKDPRRTARERMVHSLAILVTRPVLVLFFGWVIKQFL